MNLLQSAAFKCGVSSVLNKDVKQHGKHFMFDQEEDTSWSSDQGTPQWIAIQFEESQSLKEFSFQFQGGFVGKDATIFLESNEGDLLSKEPFYPEDINSVQQFVLKNPIVECNIKKVKFIFEASTDFFGRIIVYKLQLHK